MSAESRDGQHFVALVEEGRFEEALGLSIGKHQQIDTFPLKVKYHESPDAFAAISNAEATLLNESATEKITRIHNIGISLLNSSHAGDAINYLRFVASETDSPDYLLELGIAQVRTGGFNDALPTLKKAAGQEARLDKSYQNGLVHMVLLEALLGSKKADESEVSRCARNAQKSGQDDAEIAMLLVRYRQYGLAIPHLERAADREDSPVLQEQLGGLLLQNKDYNRAAKHFEAALAKEASLPTKLKGNPDLGLAIVYTERGDLTKADFHLHKSADKGNTVAKKLLRKKELTKSKMDAIQAVIDKITSGEQLDSTEIRILTEADLPLEAITQLHALANARREIQNPMYPSPYSEDLYAQNVSARAPRYRPSIFKRIVDWFRSIIIGYF